MPTIPSVPDLYEKDLFAAVDSRTGSLRFLRELGPPDLVHFVKQNVKSGSKQFGVFHHVTGIDASSSASLAAYIYTLQQSTVDKTATSVSGTYCCYNAFSRLDMRVQVTIPGSVESFCFDERGERRVATEELWLETFLCGVLRAYYYADDGSGETMRTIIGMRRFNPITTEDGERRFIQAVEKLFFQGWQLGSDPETQVPTIVSNHLTAILLTYFRATGRYATGIALFEKLRAQEPEVSSLLARLYLLANEEVKAVQLLNDSIKAYPMDYSLLDCQADFCNKKGRPDMAVEVAKRSVIAAPSEFATWSRLVEVYINSEQWDLALLTLNSCPMFTFQDTDGPRIPEPRKIVQPILPQSICPQVQDEIPEGENVPEGLRRLHAATLRGTFMKAYSLLTEITKRIGWDPLLQVRSQVFVMEEEYRNEKHSVQPGGVESPATNGEAVSSTDKKTASKPLSDDEGSASSSDEQELSSQSGTSPLPQTSSELSPGLVIDRPPSAAPPGDKPRAANGNDETVPGENSRLRNKRLCERWLDNLFMVLYEDLQVYTTWRTEVSRIRLKANHQVLIQNSRSSSAWELLGNLASRLHQDDDAVEAYQACLVTRFSARAMKGVLNHINRKHILNHHRAHPNPRLNSQFNIYRHPMSAAPVVNLGNVNSHSNTGAITNTSSATVDALIRSIAWQYRWYSEFCPELIYSVRQLIDEEGAVKVRSLIQSTNFPQSVRDLALGYAQLCSDFRHASDVRE